MVRHPILSLILTAALQGAGQCAWAAAPADEALAEQAASCAACHGQEGVSSNPLWPNLAGQHARYLVKQLQAFQGGVRKDPNMSAMAAPLRPEEMEALAKHFSALKAKPTPIQRIAALPGERIYRGGNRQGGLPACMACHGPSGAGNPGNAVPALRGQQSAYTIKQLQAYKKGERTTDGESAAMRGIAARLTDKQMEDVATYLSGLH
jgi:cytochrome c553